MHVSLERAPVNLVQQRSGRGDWAANPHSSLQLAHRPTDPPAALPSAHLLWRRCKWPLSLHDALFLPHSGLPTDAVDWTMPAAGYGDCATAAG